MTCRHPGDTACSRCIETHEDQERRLMQSLRFPACCIEWNVEAWSNAARRPRGNEFGRCPGCLNVVAP